MRLTALLMASTMLAGAAGAQEITVWDWKSGDPVTAGYYDSARAAFEAAHPGATVNFVVQPHDQYYTLLGTALASGEGPDVILLHGGSQTTTRTDALVDLTADAAGFSGLDAFSVDGATFALPLTIQGFVIYYNRARYAEAGLDPAAAPQTYEELGAVCDAIIAAGQVPCFALGNKEGFGGEFMATLATANSFTPRITPPGSRVSCPGPTPRCGRSWTSGSMGRRAAGIRKVPILPPSSWTNTSPSCGARRPIPWGCCRTWRIGSSSTSSWGQRTWAPSPSRRRGQRWPGLPFAGGIGWAVSATSDQPDLSRDLVRILADAERQAIFAIDTGALPANSARSIPRPCPARP